MLCSACGARNQSTSYCANCGSPLTTSALLSRQATRHATRPGPTPGTAEPGTHNLPGGSIPGGQPIALPVPAAPEQAPVITHSRGARGKNPEVYLALQHSEAAVLHAASRIFAAYVTTGQVNDKNESEFMAKAVRNAVRMAVYTDKLVQSDEEET